LNKPLNKASIEQLFIHSIATSVSLLHSDGADVRISDNELMEIFKEYKYEDALDYICSKSPVEIQKKYPGNHTNWWNATKIIKMLNKAGFKNIYLSGYGQSRCPVLRNTSLFDSTNLKVSLYVEARK